MIRVAALTSGRDVPSRRYRVAQLTGALADRSIVVSEHYPAIRKDTLPRILSGGRARRRVGHVAMLVPRLALRTTGIAATYRSDFTLLQREFVPGLKTLEGLTRGPRGLDIDDAIWSRNSRTERMIGSIVRQCDVVFAGNQFIEDWVHSVGGRPVIVPTTVETRRFRVKPDHELVDRFGWVGSSSNLHQLVPILPHLRDLNRRWGIRLVVVADQLTPELRGCDFVEHVPWKPDVEFDMCDLFDVGLMPLGSGTWEEGKCGMKALQYMAAGIPTIAGSTRMTRQLQGGAVIAGDIDAWGDALGLLATEEFARRSLAESGLRLVREQFDIQVAADRLATAIESAVSDGR